MRPGTLVFAALLASAILPTSVFATTLYSWRTADGTFVFTDNPKGAPADVQVRVWTERDVAPSRPEPESAPDAVAAVSPRAHSSVETFPVAVTQGEFVVRLVEELGLSERPDPNEAKDLLTRVRIGPRLGRWDLDQPMTPELTIRLRRLTVASASEEWIPLTPEEGLLAFDTTAALLGVAIPEPGESGEGGPEAYPPIDDMPALVFVSPPPAEIYPYYSWQPVADGFWENEAFDGVYVLNLDRYADHHDRYRHKQKAHRHGKTAMSPGRIGRHFRGQATGIPPDLRNWPRAHWDSDAPRSIRSRQIRGGPKVHSPAPGVTKPNRTGRQVAIPQSRDPVAAVPPLSPGRGLSPR